MSWHWSKDKPSELTFPLRSISLDPWDLTKQTLAWNSKNTELSSADWLTLSWFLEILVTWNSLWRIRVTLELNGDKNEDEPNCLNSFDRKTKLFLNHCLKLFENIQCFRFCFKQKNSGTPSVGIVRSSDLRIIKKEGLN